MAHSASPRSYSQYGQDLFLINEIFRLKRDGIFVEIGAADGVALSNTKMLEDSFGWKGFLIEPNPDEFAKLVSNRPLATCINAAVYSNDADSIDFRKITGYSMMLSGIEKAYDPKHVSRIESEIRSCGGSYEIIPVAARKFESICSEHGITEIDLLCIDVEGSELDILRGINFDSVRINVIMVEDNYNEFEKFESLLKDKGFTYRCKIGVDLVFTAPWL